MCSITSTQPTQRLPIADQWFQVDEMDDGVLCITEPHVDPILAANIWFIPGKHHDVVVDSGLGIVSLYQRIPKIFDNDPLLILSHTHLDHAGGAYEFPRCAAHPAEAWAVTAPRSASLVGYDQQVQLGLNAFDMAPWNIQIPDLLISAVPSAEFTIGTYSVLPGHLTNILGDGHVIDLGDRRLAIIHLPGHTPGGIGILDETNDTLYSGDIVYDGGPLLDRLTDSSISDYSGSMKKLRDLSISNVRPGHGLPFSRKRLHELTSEYLARDYVVNCENAMNQEQPST